MKKYILFCLLAFAAQTYGQSLTTFILVRHAEKANDGTKDPDLTVEGNQRAQLLANMLKESKIDAIYSTSYKRTINTVAPLAKLKGLAVVTYEPNSSAQIDTMLLKHNGGTIVVSGHSNTIPEIVNYLLGKDRYQNFEDSDYNNLIVVSVLERGKTTAITWLNY